MDKLTKIENKFGVIDSYCELTPTSLSFTRDITKDEWQQVYSSLSVMDKCVQFWIGDCLKYREQKWGMYDDVVESTGYSKKTIENIKQVASVIEPSRRREDLSFSHHKEVSPLEPEQQEYWLDKASNEGLSVRQLSTEIKNNLRDNNISNKKSIWEENLPHVGNFSIDIYNTDKKFRIIYADPPWKYDDAQNNPNLGGAEKHYNTMSIEELCNLPIKNITEKDAVLFLWVTSPKLNQCWDIISAWGFEYKTSFVWDKIKHNMGHYNSVRHEFLLICGKGKSTPDVQKLYDSVQSIERSDKHSEKPIEFINIIDDLYIYGNRIELFARDAKKEDWFYFGNEV